MSDPSVAGLKSSQEVADSFHNMHIAIELVSTSCLAGQYCSILGLQLGKNIDDFFPKWHALYLLVVSREEVSRSVLV